MTGTKEQPSHYNQEDAEETLRFTIDSAIIGMTHRTNIMDESVVKALSESIYQAVFSKQVRWAVKILLQPRKVTPYDLLAALEKVGEDIHLMMYLYLADGSFTKQQLYSKVKTLGQYTTAVLAKEKEGSR